MVRINFMVFLTLFLTACSTSPLSNYYVLTANSEVQVIENSHNPEKQSFTGVGPVMVPEFLQRSQIAYSLSGNKLILSGYDRWSEPVDQAIARVLAVNLSRLDHNRSTSIFPWRKVNQPDFALQISVRDLNRDSANKAVLDADWILLNVNQKEILLRGKFFETIQLSEFSYSELVRAYSDLLAMLSSEIDAELRKQRPASDLIN